MNARAALLAWIALLSAAPAAQAANQQITAATNAAVLTPAEVTVFPGDVVTISRAAGGVFPHNAHYDDSAASCPAAPVTSAWSCPRTFATVGDYTFHCDLHTSMQGTVHVVPLAEGAAVPGRTQLLSPNTTGTASANGSAFLDDVSLQRQVSDDGRYVVFASAGTDPTAISDTNSNTDVFSRDRVSGATALVSVNAGGTAAGAGQSAGPAISADGRYVAFYSRAADLVSGFTDGNGQVGDIFVRDMVAGTTTLVSAKAGSATTSGNGENGTPSISADGHRIAFNSDATDLVSGVTDSNATADVFARDVPIGTTVAVSVTSAGTATGNSISSGPVISSDGRFVAFSSSASDLIATDTNGGAPNWDAFRRDLVAGTTQAASVNSAGTDTGNGLSGNQVPPAISADGRRVLFISLADNLVGGFLDNNGSAWDLFERDFDAGTTALVSGSSATAGATAGSATGVMSPDGRFVAFVSQAALVPGVSDVNAAYDVFRRDVDAGTTAVVSVDASGAATPPVQSRVAAISANGREVVFTSAATTLTPLADGNAKPDAFRRDMTRGATSMLSTNAAGIAASGGGIDDASGPIATPDARFVVFRSVSTDLVQPFVDGNAAGGADLFARGNLAPTSAFTASPLTGTSPLEVAFSSTASDPDGTIATRDWQFGDGTSATGTTTSHTYATGSYSATLTVSDDSGESVSGSRGITANAPAQATPTPTPTPTPAPSATPTPAPSATPTPAPAAHDRIAPALVLSGATTQRALRQKALVVTARADERAAASATGKLAVPRRKTVNTSKATALLTAGSTTTLRLKLSKRALATIKAALARGAKVTATVSVTATDADGNRTTRTRRIRITR